MLLARRLRGRHPALIILWCAVVGLGAVLGAPRTMAAPAVDCPPDLVCRMVPAAYQRNNPDDPADYGNYDVADRAADGLGIRYIIIHDTEGSYEQAITIFQQPRSYLSAHYVLRSADGEITQMVDPTDVAWTAGNWYVNTHAINLEHEGVALDGDAWFTEEMYRSSARLVRYLADKYGVPLDRAHIIGSDEVPGPTAQLHSAMHWDPGPFWDWVHYMELIGAPIAAPDEPTQPNIITIRPPYATNWPPISSCGADGCRDVRAPGANFVYLYSTPSFDVPLLDDPALPGPGSTNAADWGNKAAAGQVFYRAARQGDWDAIFFGGQLGWFYNPGGINTLAGRGTLITPKAGAGSIPVYGRAYPEAAAYGASIPPQPLERLQYTIPDGQVYVASDLVPADYYWSPTQTERGVVEGATPYYVIFFNHRLAYVRASDVDIVWKPAP